MIELKYKHKLFIINKLYKYNLIYTYYEKNFKIVIRRRK